MPRIRKRVKAKKPRLSREQRAKKKARETLTKALSWKDKEVERGKSWTSFEIPLHKLEHMYNLLPDVCDSIKIAFQEGRPETDSVSSLLPAKPNVIWQDILADIFFFKYGFSVNDFTTAKNLATARNRNNSRPKQHVAEEEISKWPARPDVFLHCRQIPLNAATMDEMADYFRYEKFETQLRELKESDNEILDGIDEEVDRAYILSSPVEAHDSATNPNSVELLRDLYMSLDENSQWDETVKEGCEKYQIGRTKMYECRAAIRCLLNSEIEGITCEDFEEPFTDDALMKMPQGPDKKEAIVRAVTIYKSKG